jgi:hypothetical protein
MKRFFTTLGKQSAILAVSLLLAFSPFTSLLTVAQAQVGAETSASQVSPAVAKPSNPSGGVSSANDIGCNISSLVYIYCRYW